MAGYLAYKAITGLASVLPRSFQYALARRLAGLHYLCDRRARLSVIANMRVILGKEADEKSIRREARRVFSSFGLYLCEFFGHRKFGPAFIDKHVQVKGLEHLQAALAAGRGALFCSAHYSNWELGATVVAHLGYPILAVVQKHSEERSNSLFVKQREEAGVQVVHSLQGATAALKALRHNQTVALLGDRTTGGPVVMAQLFSRPTPLPQGPWRIALLSGAALLPTFVLRRPDGGYILEIGAPLATPETGLRAERLAALARAWARCLEERLRADPSQWAVFFKVWDEEPKNNAFGTCQAALPQHHSPRGKEDAAEAVLACACEDGKP
jgi:KDO2-lipid IV(A) lauroyltransferase